MATLETDGKFTVNDAAERFDRTTARIRQICIEQDIGVLVEERIRLLSKDDMRKIGDFLAEFGRQRKS